jgi:hypothetical protein
MDLNRKVLALFAHLSQRKQRLKQLTVLRNQQRIWGGTGRFVTSAETLEDAVAEGSAQVE